MLYQAGPAKSGFNGPTALDWQDLHAFSQSSGYRLTGYELEVIRELSTIYVSTLDNAKDPNHMPFYSAPVSSIERMNHMKAQRG